MDELMEKLLVLLDAAHDELENYCAGDCSVCEHDVKSFGCIDVRLAKHLITNGVTIQKWIPVSERPPEVASTHQHRRYTSRKSIRVLCVCVLKSGKRKVKEGYCEWYSDYPEPRWRVPGEIDYVTHWMPLPEPPKEV